MQTGSGLVAVQNRPAFQSYDRRDAAATLTAFGTAWHMLVTRARLVRGETVLVLAARSGIGSAAIQIAKHLRCRVLATASTDDKLARPRVLGAGHGAN